jgi:hypothetical protein
MTTKRAATAKQNRKLQWVRLQQHDVGGADVWACSDCKHAFATSVHAVGEDENSSASTTTADTADTAALADTAATLATTSGSRRGKSFKDIKTVRSAVTLLRKAAEREKELKRTVRALTEAKQMALDGKQKSKKAAAKQAKLLNKLVNENLYIACEKLVDAGRPPAFHQLAASVVDGRLPLDSIPYMRFEATASNLRQKFTTQFRYSEHLQQLASQALNCDGAGAAYEFMRGTWGRGKNKRQFDTNVLDHNMNDPALPSERNVRQRDKKQHPVPLSGFNLRMMDAIAEYLQDQVGIEISNCVLTAAIDTDVPSLEVPCCACC